MRWWMGLLVAGPLWVPWSSMAAPWQIEADTVVQVDADWHGKTVTVRFPTVAGNVDFDERDLSAARAVVAVATGNATTGVGVVDQVVKGGDFLDARDFPQITFHLDKLTQTSKSTADVLGRITMRGVTRPVLFKATVIRYGADPGAPDRFAAGFDIRGSIDRTEFGSTGGLPDVDADLGVRIRLMLHN